jgi:hypothetical protein
MTPRGVLPYHQLLAFFKKLIVLNRFLRRFPYWREMPTLCSMAANVTLGS